VARFSSIFWQVGALLTLAPAVGFCTTIIALKSQSDIYVAADSKMKIVDESGNVQELFVCKISQFKEIFYGFGGWAINLEPVVREAGTDSKNVRELVDNFVRLAEPRIRAAYESLWRASPTLHKLALARGPVSAFFGYENQATVLYIRAFRPTKIPRAVAVPFTIEGEDCDGRCPKLGFQPFFPSLVSEAPRKFLMANRNYLQATAPIDAIKKLVALDVEARPADSGPPIDILHITRDGARWIEVKRCT
jgi:hypothetical protein